MTGLWGNVGFNSVWTDSPVESEEVQGGRDEIQSHVKKKKKRLKHFWPHLTPAQELSRDNWNRKRRRNRKASAVQGVIKTNQVNHKQKFTLEVLLRAKTSAATCMKDQPPPRFLQMYTHDIYEQAHARKNTLSLSHRLRCKEGGGLVPFLLSL